MLFSISLFPVSGLWDVRSAVCSQEDRSYCKCINILSSSVSYSPLLLQLSISLWSFLFHINSISLLQQTEKTTGLWHIGESTCFSRNNSTFWGICLFSFLPWLNEIDTTLICTINMKQSLGFWDNCRLPTSMVQEEGMKSKEVKTPDQPVLAWWRPQANICWSKNNCALR